MLITSDVLRQQKHCISGARAIFKKHGLCYKTFFTTGLESEDLLATNDPIIVEVVTKCLEEEDKTKD